VQCNFEPIGVHTARWVYCADERKLAEFKTKAYDHLAVDHSGALVYLAPSRVNLGLIIERWPEIVFRETREQAN
jgi:peptide chain release factor 3